MVPAWTACAVLLLYCCLKGEGVEGHGYLAVPASRSFLVSGQKNHGFSPQGFYGPMNLNRVGRALRGATCGGEKAGDTRFEVGGKFAQRKIVATYKAGAYVKTKVRIDINHWGYFELRLCPLPSTTDAAEKKAFGETCFAKHPLKLKLANGRLDTKLWMYHKEQSYDVVSTWKLPNVKCKRCVLQWRYITAHMCFPPGINKSKMKSLLPAGRHTCASNFRGISVLPPEKFWSCADVRLV